MIRKTIFALTALLMLFSHYESYAQYAPATKTENQYTQKPTAVYTGQGQAMMNTGKTLLYTGASIALTGLTCYIAGAASYNPDPCCPDMPMYPVFALAGAAAGAAVALIGLPFYIYGNNKMESYGASHIVFGKEGQEGGAGFFEMGLGIPNFLSFDALGGYNFGKNFFMGAGVGYKTYLTAGLIQEGATASLPVYGNARYSFGNRKVVPYIGASTGYDIVNAGLYTGVEFGTRFRKAGAKRGESWWFGARTEMTSTEYIFLSLKVGRSF